MLNKIRTQLISLLGGFPTVTAAIDSVKDDAARHAVLTKAVRKLYVMVNASDILRPSKTGEWIFEGKPISQGVRAQMVAEAQAFSESTLWKVLRKDIQYQAGKRMFIHGTDTIHMVSGKLWVYTLDSFKTRLASMIEGKPTFNTKK